MMFNIGRVSGNNFTRNTDELDWLKYISDLQPTGELISETLGVSYGADRDLHMREQVVFHFVERFVQNLNARHAQLFMKFVTGCKTVKPITVTFNSEDDEHKMIPQAQTCSSALKVSRFTPNFDWFSNTMMNVLTQDHARRGFQFA